MSKNNKVIKTAYAESVDISVPNNNIPVILVDPIPENREISENMLMCYSLGKTVKWLSLIDIFFSFIYALYNPYFFITIFIAYNGYYGAKKYYTCPTLTYFIYNFVGNIARIGYSIYLFSLIDSEHQNDFTFSFVFSIFCGIIGLWIARIIYRFYLYMNKLSQEELFQLRILHHHRNYRVIIW
uniref:Uncharacterized protein n=1 Tax=viral metagenome TaxID=1070528 RepID=A0A6C0LYP5_9ZZZZ